VINKIVFDTPLETLPTEEQNRIFELAHDNNVFVRDVNGELWKF
jgi:hypothetical protein